MYGKAIPRWNSWRHQTNHKNVKACMSRMLLPNNRRTKHLFQPPHPHDWLPHRLAGTDAKRLVAALNALMAANHCEVGY